VSGNTSCNKRSSYYRPARDYSACEPHNHERLQAATIDGDTFKKCHEAIGQNGITTAMGFVRCWGEPSRTAYQQSDLLIMDLVENRLDVLYKAAVLRDNRELTSEQFWDTYTKQMDWFFSEIGKRFNGQLTASASTPTASPTPAPRYYK
jgi:hypothetical protein